MSAFRTLSATVRWPGAPLEAAEASVDQRRRHWQFNLRIHISRQARRPDNICLTILLPPHERYHGDIASRMF